MLKKISWKENSILSIKLKDNLYTLAQMRCNHLMEFFDVSREDSLWSSMDLTNELVIFCVYVAESRIKPLFDRVLPSGSVIPNSRPVAKIMLSAIIEEGGKYGADLVELDGSYDSVSPIIIKRDLDKNIDIDLIRSYELTGMVGSPEKLKARLIRYFESGVNWDDSKNFLFPGIQPPPPVK